MASIAAPRPKAAPRCSFVVPRDAGKSYRADPTSRDPDAAPPRIFLDRQRWKDLALLRHPCDTEVVAAKCRQCVNPRAMQIDFAAMMRRQPAQRFDQRRLADAVRPITTSISPRADGKRNAMQRARRSISCRQVRDHECRDISRQGRPPDPRIGTHLVRRVLHDKAAGRENGNDVGVAEHDIHVVLDEQNRRSRHQRRKLGKQFVTLLRRQPRRRFVEQQHLRVERKGKRHFEKTLLAVGQRVGRRQGIALQAEFREQRHRLVDQPGFARDAVQRSRCDCRVRTAPRRSIPAG